MPKSEKAQHPPPTGARGAKVTTFRCLSFGGVPARVNAVLLSAVDTRF